MGLSLQPPGPPVPKWNSLKTIRRKKGLWVTFTLNPFLQWGAPSALLW